MSEKFSWGKLLSAPSQPLYYAKVASLWGGPVLLLLIGYTFYRAYFKRMDTNKIIARQGSTVNVISERKRFFIPFIEAYVDQPSNEDFGAGLRAGLRFEF